MEGGWCCGCLAQGATGGWDEGPALPLQLRFPNGCSVGESSAENRAGPCRVHTESEPEPEPPLKIATVARAGPGQKRCTFKSTRLVLFIIAGFQQQIHRDQNNLFPCLHFPYDVFPPAPLSFKSTTHDDGTDLVDSISVPKRPLPDLMPQGTAQHHACSTPPLVGT